MRIARQVLHECSSVSQSNICCLFRGTDQSPGHWRQVSHHVLPCTRQKAWQEFCIPSLTDQAGALLLVGKCLLYALPCPLLPTATGGHESLLQKLVCGQAHHMHASSDAAAADGQRTELCLLCRSQAFWFPRRPSITAEKALTHPFFQTVAAV